MSDERPPPPGPTHLSGPAGSTFRPKRLSMPITVIWAISPAVLMIVAVLLFGREWPWLRWVVFIGGVLNMGVFSIWQLWSRGITGWEFKCIPLSLVMLLLNMLLVIAATLILGLPLGPTPET